MSNVLEVTMKIGILVVVLFFIPATTKAAILINEIAWMGSKESANNEWIELYNNGSSAVSVDEWVLTDNVSLNILLSGTILPGAYEVLERTDDDSAKGSAFLIYTGALSNEGRTMTLFDSSGGVVDRVFGGENWQEIGGDNETKHTAQRITSGWITALGTPGKQNENEPIKTEEAEKNIISNTETNSNEDSGDGSKKNVSISLEEPNNELTLTIFSSNIAYVNQPVSFKVEPSGIGNTFMDSLSYVWSFGDATSRGGKEITHAYTHPGTYIAVVEGSFNKYQARARHEITILPVTFSITRTEAGNIQLHNNAEYEIDLTGFTLRGDKVFKIPKNTFLLPNGTLTIAKHELENRTEKMLAFYDQKNEMVASYVPLALQTAPPDTDEIAEEESEIDVEDEVLSTENIESTPSTETVLEPIEEKETVLDGANQAAAAAESSLESPGKLFYYALIGIMGLAILALYTRRSGQSN